MPRHPPMPPAARPCPGGGRPRGRRPARSLPLVPGPRPAAAAPVRGAMRLDACSFPLWRSKKQKDACWNRCAPLSTLESCHAQIHRYVGEGLKWASLAAGAPGNAVVLRSLLSRALAVMRDVGYCVGYRTVLCWLLGPLSTDLPFIMLLPSSPSHFLTCPWCS